MNRPAPHAFLPLLVSRPLSPDELDHTPLIPHDRSRVLSRLGPACPRRRPDTLAGWGLGGQVPAQSTIQSRSRKTHMMDDPRGGNKAEIEHIHNYFAGGMHREHFTLLHPKRPTLAARHNTRGHSAVCSGHSCRQTVRDQFKSEQLETLSHSSLAT